MISNDVKVVDDEDDDDNVDTKTNLLTLTAFVILVWKEAGHPSTLMDSI